MNATILIGHGSLRSASGAAMIRMAARLRELEIAPLAEAGFLNYSRPTLAEAVEKVVALGATSVTVQPYFLIDGVYVRQDLHQEVAVLAQAHPGIAFRMGKSFGAHPAMIDIAQDRITQADPSLGLENGPTGLLILAHGTPIPAANAPLAEIAAALHDRGHFAQTRLAFLDCNTPTIPEAIQALTEAGIRRILALPYFLQFGRHVREDLPAHMADAQIRHPGLVLTLAEHLGYDLRLADVIRDRIVTSNE